MANKFQKSVMERLEQDAAQQKKKSKEENQRKQSLTSSSMQTTGIDKKPGENPEEANMTSEEIKKTEPLAAGVQEISIKEKVQKLPDISEYLRKEPPRLAKNKTFYLDSDVIKAIKQTARGQDVTDSKLVNDILRRVLGLR